jgi:uncharacterized protein YbgA (DUF1722 family)
MGLHPKHRLLVLSHGRKHCQPTGGLVPGARELTKKALYEEYQNLMMEALRLKMTTRKKGNVLEHMMGYFKKNLSQDEKQELFETIGVCQNSYVSLIVPITPTNHYVRKYNQPCLRNQNYLNSQCVELQPRNHV